jgi:hypothetical protein
MDKKELVDAVIEMIKQDAAAGDWRVRRQDKDLCI